VRAAVAGLAASVVFSLPVCAVAARVDVGAGDRSAALALDAIPNSTPTGAGATAGLSTDCAKCHSACEDGISHAGLAPTVTRGGSLPIDARGTIGCLTCHVAHDGDTGGSGGARLRIANLRRELCLACHCPEEDAPRIEIVSPLERAVVREDRLALIGRAARLPQDLLTVRLNGSAFSVHVKGGRFSTWLSLQDGVNRIEIALADRVLWEGEVFHGPGALGRYGRTSSSHGTANREECLGCHLLLNGVGEGTPVAAQALCYRCHDRFEGKRYAHGPLAVGDCLACHDPHGGFGSAHLRQETVVLCRTCHPGREGSPRSACDAAGEACVACHDPHQSDARYLLRGPRYTMRGAAPRSR